jgi:hypothetical protein
MKKTGNKHECRYGEVKITSVAAASGCFWAIWRSEMLVRHNWVSKSSLLLADQFCSEVG